jgi:hypothetical protein
MVKLSFGPGATQKWRRQIRHLLICALVLGSFRLRSFRFYDFYAFLSQAKSFANLVNILQYFYSLKAVRYGDCGSWGRLWVIWWAHSLSL